MFQQPRPLTMPHHYRVEVGPLTAGNNWTYTPDARTWIQANSIVIVLNTDATVATRRLVLVMGGPTDDDIIIPSRVTQAASLSYQYIFLYNIGFIDATAAASRVMLPLPQKHMIQNPENIRTEITNLQAGDVITAVKARLYLWQDPVFV